MPIVAITREMGTLGKDVASGLGQTLGLPIYYHEMADHLADRMRVRKSHVIRLVKSEIARVRRDGTVPPAAAGSCAGGARACRAAPVALDARHQDIDKRERRTRHAGRRGRNRYAADDR
ncbi:MAG: hypothetical protein EXR29_12855 [Betaproteobacteria bacterium]|nr:hypothetical protein [Betaproteobacteria bacterium]